MSSRFWLLKAEPDSRIVKGKDVKFSVDDFERVQTSPWEGVRNYEARNLMREMQIGEKAVFYHSNCKNPGIAGFAEVSKLAYPDYTAWDESHPYYDSKSQQDNPRWYMVDLTFTARAKHFIPLALLRYIADCSQDDPPEEIKYIGPEGIQAIKCMGLITRGRLSVQRVSLEAWETIQLLAENGGWEDMPLKPSKKSSGNKTSNIKKKPRASKTTTKTGRKKLEIPNDAESQGSPLTDLEDEAESASTKTRSSASRKRKVSMEDDIDDGPPRRSSRRKVGK